MDVAKLNEVLLDVFEKKFEVRLDYLKCRAAAVKEGVPQLYHLVARHRNVLFVWPLGPSITDENVVEAMEHVGVLVTQVQPVSAPEAPTTSYAIPASPPDSPTER
jgi:hypothetical protein